ncbi:MAG: hypothetical protein EXR86_01880 [Gammaproteobacteria bacterium]|nr:hypothetical protein [Gammaproteobacteria bacterium]
MNEDFLDILRALRANGTQFLVVGAHALAGHGVVRATGDLDIWVNGSPQNIPRIWSALALFGAPVAALGIVPEDFGVTGTVIQIGLPPRRIDLMTSITGVDFEDAWRSRFEITIADLLVPLLSRSALIKNKLTLGRAQDLVDVETLARLASREK